MAHHPPAPSGRRTGRSPCRGEGGWPDIESSSDSNYPGPGKKEKRAEPGDIVDGLPETSVRWLTRDGFIEPATERKASKKAQRTREVNEAVEAADQPAEVPEKLEEVEGGDS